VATGDSELAVIARLLARPVDDVTQAVWGFTNRTDIVTLADGDRVVLQRYRRGTDAEHRLRVMGTLWAPADAAGIAIPRVRASDLEADPAWVMFDLLPGDPVPAAGDAAPGGPGFEAIARTMGELLAAFRRLPTDGLELDDLWAEPERLAAEAAVWVEAVSEQSPSERTPATALLDSVPALFAGRPPVLAHGDFAPVNVLTDGTNLTGLLDFEAVRLADPLFDAAWWAWSVSFASETVLEAAWPAFLHGAGIDTSEPDLSLRVRTLQVLRMLELLAGDGLTPDVRRIVADRLRTMLW
jgi:aminoglycoside phosphotransferase (APT) family kinase protein